MTDKPEWLRLFIELISHYMRCKFPNNPTSNSDVKNGPGKNVDAYNNSVALLTFVSAGEFANIKNNPLHGTDEIGYAGVDIITQ